MFMNAYQNDAKMYAMCNTTHTPERIFSQANPNALDPSGVKFSCLVSPEPGETELKFLAQMGVTHTYTWIEEAQGTVAFLSNLKGLLEAHGIVLWIVGMLAVGKSKDIILNTPNRAERLDAFRSFLQVLHEVGVHTTIFTFEPSSAYQTGHNLIRGGALGRYCSTEVLSQLPLAYDREYTEGELWNNMQYFLDEVVPTAERLGVVLAFHPNDPPSEIPFRGVPNIIRDAESCEKVFSMANSENVKMEFCCGCWLEGGDRMGNLLSVLRGFIRRGKVVNVHLRNVSDTMPDFTEVFLDEGYGDIAEIVHVLVEEAYNGTLILDHSPELSGGRGLETAYCTGYIKAMIRASQRFLKGVRTTDLTACLKEGKKEDK